MATECYGRGQASDGIGWIIYHQLWSGPWWWVLTMPDGRLVESPERYETERQALGAVEDAHRQALAGLPPMETMSSLRARAEAAETRAAQAEASVEAWRGLLLSRVRERCGDPDLHTDRPGAERDPEHRLWRVVSHRGVAGVGHTEAEALLRAFDAIRAGRG